MNWTAARRQRKMKKLKRMKLKRMTKWNHLATYGDQGQDAFWEKTKIKFKKVFIHYYNFRILSIERTK
jgi:hypothetical protein